MALALTILTAFATASDIIHAIAMRQWAHGSVASGMDSMRLAARLNPFSFEVRLDEIESLWEGYRQESKLEYLHEAVLISRSLTKDFPGNTLAWSVYSSALIFEATHGGSAAPIDEALHAVRLDPISVTTAERAMFLMAAKRVDYGEFKQLGIARSRLTREPLRMVCELCGKKWMDHK
jgi:hypothetical protein